MDGFSDSPRYADAQAIAHYIAELYSEQEVDRVVVIYNHFESALTQRVVAQEVLPIPESLLEGDDDLSQALLGDFIYEPEPEQILERLLPVYVETELYRALLESAASEQGARMTAMRNASKNAGRVDRQPDAADEPRPPGRSRRRSWKSWPAPTRYGVILCSRGKLAFPPSPFPWSATRQAASPPAPMH